MEIPQKQPDGWYKHDGCDYEDLEGAIQTGMLGFCGCGVPDENLDYIRTGLSIINDRPPRDRSGFDAWWEQHRAKCDAHFGNIQAEYFFYYWADKEGLTEHGGSVPGWLDDDGMRLLAMLDEWSALPGKEGE